MKDLVRYGEAFKLKSCGGCGRREICESFVAIILVKI
jgi:hypothetical protein